MCSTHHSIDTLCHHHHLFYFFSRFKWYFRWGLFWLVEFEYSAVFDVLYVCAYVNKSLNEICHVKQIMSVQKTRITTFNLNAFLLHCFYEHLMFLPRLSMDGQKC